LVMRLGVTDDGFSLSTDDVEVSITCEHQQAEKPQQENIIRQLSRLGGTPYECSRVELPDVFGYFIPSSLLAELRRRLVEALGSVQRSLGLRGSEVRASGVGALGFEGRRYGLPYLYNISNRLAREFYVEQGLSALEPAFEIRRPRGEQLLMQCRHCLRYSLGCCVKHGGSRPSWKEPLFLRLGDGRRFRLDFDCKHCQMNVYAAD
jgi:putative protease